MKKMGHLRKVLFLVVGALCIDARAVVACAAEAFEGPEVGSQANDPALEREQFDRKISQLIGMATEAFIEQLIVQCERLLALRSQLFDLGYTGDKKKEILAAMRSNIPEIAQSFQGMQRSNVDTGVSDANQRNNEGLAVASVLLSVIQQPAMRKRMVAMGQDLTVFLVCHRNYAGRTVYTSVGQAKLILSFCKLINDLFEQEPEKMQQALEEHRVIASLRSNFSHKEEAILRTVLGLSDDEHHTLFCQLIEIYSRGFVKFLSILSMTGSYDLNRKDDSGETLLEWAERMELPIVADGIREIVQNS